VEFKSWTRKLKNEATNCIPFLIHDPKKMRQNSNRNIRCVPSLIPLR